jgi:tRNA modification GTPase
LQAADDPAGAVLSMDIPFNEGIPCLRIGTKADLGSVAGVDLSLSVLEGRGFSEFEALVRAKAEAQLGLGDALLTRARHVQAFQQADEALTRTFIMLDAEQLELAAEDVRLALRALSHITGRVDVEDILGQIFSSFCIGK